MRDTKEMLIYIVKRILLMLLTFSVIFFICFILIRLLPLNPPSGAGTDVEKFYIQQEALGRMVKVGPGPEEYEALPVLQQLGNFLKNLFFPSSYELSDGTIEYVSRWGYSTSRNATPPELLFSRMAPTILVNVYAMIFSVPLGLAIGTYMALKKNKWQDNFLGVVVMLFISVPSFVYSFLLQYVFAFKLGWLPATRADFNGSWFSGDMFVSMILPVISMSFGSIAGYARYTRAELTEVLTSDFMLLARTKGLTRAQATIRHAFRNSLVPIFPMLLGEILSVLSGSMIIESIFSINGVGSLFLDSITARDYDVFQFVGMFYILIGLVGGLVVDISYGLVDPRVRMGGRK